MVFEQNVNTKLAVMLLFTADDKAAHGGAGLRYVEQ